MKCRIKFLSLVVKREREPLEEVKKDEEDKEEEKTMPKEEGEKPTEAEGETSLRVGLKN